MTGSNIQAVIDLESQTLRNRSLFERVTDAVIGVASSPTFIAVHLLWFTGWIWLNHISSRSVDPYPFSFLTLAVSLEAIVLTSFVLVSQNRMTQLADRRAHLDLQVNLLAEQELTAVLKVVCVVAEKVGVDVYACDPRMDQWLGKTDLKVLSDQLTQELSAAERSGERTSTSPRNQTS